MCGGDIPCPLGYNDPSSVDAVFREAASTALARMGTGD